ncbi:MAG: DUF2282 domain-containing protein [Lysobacterales bacterium]
MHSLTLLRAALAGAVVLTATSAQAQNEAPVEKCFGIAKAGKNDCQTASSSCAGTSKQDRQPDAWIYLPKGSCDKITGGSLSPKTQDAS